MIDGAAKKKKKVFFVRSIMLEKRQTVFTFHFKIATELLKKKNILITNDERIVTKK